jgi:hypothetical protein
MLESELLHVRALTKFLFGSPPPPDRRSRRRARGKAAGLSDAFAEDYFDDPIAEWRRHPEGRGRRPSLLSDESLNRISREVAHVTYERARFLDAGSEWSPYGLYTALAPVVERFAVLVDPARLCEDFRERIDAAMPRRRPPRTERQRRPGGVLPFAATQGMPPRS